MGRRFIYAIVVGLAFAPGLLASAGGDPADAPGDAACGAIVANCGSLVVAGPEEMGCFFVPPDLVDYACAYRVRATATAITWASPGSFEVDLGGFCTATGIVTWTILGGAGDAVCVGAIVATPLTCEPAQSALAAAVYEGILPPRPLSADVSVPGHCSPFKVALHPLPSYGGPPAYFAGSDTDFTDDYFHGTAMLVNDAVSSLRMTAGCLVSLHEHPFFGGPPWTFTASTPYVGPAFDDSASSMVVSGC